MGAADKPVEFVLVDGGVLQSRSAAIQVGGETRGAFSTLVFQNITIRQSHRWAVRRLLPPRMFLSPLNECLSHQEGGRDIWFMECQPDRAGRWR